MVRINEELKAAKAAKAAITVLLTAPTPNSDFGNTPHRPIMLQS
jgi:hypothetical protein